MLAEPVCVVAPVGPVGGVVEGGEGGAVGLCAGGGLLGRGEVVRGGGIARA